MPTHIYFVLIATYFINFTALAQQTSFEYLIAHPNNDFFYDFIEDTNSNYIICNRLDFINNPEKHSVFLITLNQDGIAVDSNFISLPNKNLTIFELNRNSGEYIFSGSLTDTLGFQMDASILIGRMNDDLEIFDTVYFALPSEFRLGQVSSELCNDENIILSGFVTVNDQTPRAYLYELNAEFDSLKARFYLDDYGSITHVKKFIDTTYWFINDFKSEYQMADSSLDYLFSTEVPDYLTGNLGVKWDTDSSFYLVGDKLYPDPSHKIGFIKQYHPTNSSGHIFNQRGASDTIDYPGVWGGIDFQNNDSIFIGGTHNLDLHNPDYSKNPSWFIILQTDSMLNIRWERIYGGDAYYLMGKIIATKDGGCLVGGMRYDYQNTSELQTDVIILKLNEEGLLVGNQKTPAIVMHEAIVYPNPGTTEIKVRIAAQYQESLFQLFDMNGKQVASENIIGKWGTINTSFLKSGTYVYRISSEDGLFETGKWIKK